MYICIVKLDQSPTYVPEDRKLQIALRKIDCYSRIFIKTGLLTIGKIYYGQMSPPLNFFHLLTPKRSNMGQ